MDTWNPTHYLQFGDERTRPAVDLVMRVQMESPRTVVDLGCGPGNSTAVLKGRWPNARIVGVDSSPQMVDAARNADPAGEWVLADVREWAPAQPLNVVFSNATLQWLPDHGSLIRRLFGYVAEGGALAFQIPAQIYARVCTLIQEVAADPAWAERMRGPLALLTMEPLTFYYDQLAPLASAVDAWETEYLHVMASQVAIVEWISSTGLRPFVEALATEVERRRFVDLLQERVSESYGVRADGKVLLAFQRMFMIAYKGAASEAERNT